MMRYAVVSVNRMTGQARTERTFEDPLSAQRYAAEHNQRFPDSRYTSVPFQLIEERK
jgi:hypothetical protein